MHLQDFAAEGTWPFQGKKLNISMLQMKAVHLALNAFLHRIMGESVILMSDIATVVASQKKLGGTNLLISGGSFVMWGYTVMCWLT